MPRRFTGDDDWLDDVKVPARHKAGKKPVQSRAQTLQPEEGNGTVTEIFPNQSAARLDGEVQTSLCGYRMSTLAFGLAKR